MRRPLWATLALLSVALPVRAEDKKADDTKPRMCSASEVWQTCVDNAAKADLLYGGGRTLEVNVKVNRVRKTSTGYALHSVESSGDCKGGTWFDFPESEMKALASCEKGLEVM